MAISVNTIHELKEYFSGVVLRSLHHAPGVDEVIYSLLGFIVLNIDENSAIEVRSYAEAPGNILWIFINGIRYSFRYEHSDDTIEIRKNNYKGDLISKINNQTSIAQLKKIFEDL